MWALVAACLLGGCGGSSRGSVSRSEFISATRSSGLGPVRVLDNQTELAKLGQSFHQPGPPGGAADETLVVSVGAHDPGSARLYGVRFGDSTGAKNAERDGGTDHAVRVCNVVLMSAASDGSADRHRFDRLISALRKRC